MRILTLPEATLPPEWRRQVDELRQDAWPTESPELADSDHDPALEPLSILLLDAETVVAALTILMKDLVHAGHTYRAGGLSTVVTRSSLRRQGHGLRLVRAARRHLSPLGLDLGLFTCDRPLRPFYERAGWEVLRGTVLVGGTVEAPFPSDQPGWDKVTLAGFASARARAARASFQDARIELYPGEVDRLW